MSLADTRVLDDIALSPRLPLNEAIAIDGVTRRDDVRWGPIIAGVVTAFATLLFLTVVGVALGLSALGGDDNPQGWGTAAGIWGGLTLLLTFFAGGWMAGRGSGIGPDSNGLINGFLAGAATLLLLLWFATTAVTGVLGFFTGTITDLAGGAAPAALEIANEAPPAVTDDAPTAATEAGAEIQEALPANTEEAAAAAAEIATERVGPGAWGAAVVIFLAVGVASIAGKLGQTQSKVVAIPRGTTLRR